MGPDLLGHGSSVRPHVCGVKTVGRNAIPVLRRTSRMSYIIAVLVGGRPSQCPISATASSTATPTATRPATPSRATSPRSTRTARSRRCSNAAGEEILLAGSPHRHLQQRAGSRLRLRLPAGLAEGDAQADGVGQPRRDVPARADAARVRRAGAAAQDAREPGRRALRPLPRRLALWPPSTTSPTPTPSTPTSSRSTAGTTRRGASTTRTASTPPPCCRCATSTGPWPSPTRSSRRGAKVVLLPTGPAYGRSPGDPYFDPIWARLNEAGVVGRAAHHAVLVLRRHLARVGSRPRSRPRGTCRRGSG